MQESALIDRAQTGDATAFGALFDAYQGPIVGYLYQLVGNRELAHDLAQDTFLKAFRGIERTGQELDFRAWLYRIATNTAYSHHRKQRLRRWLPLGTEDNEPAADLALAESLGERELIAAALRAAGPRHASILLLRYREQLSVEEVATTLGININTAKTRLLRARRAFAAAYTRLSGDDTNTQ